MSSSLWLSQSKCKSLKASVYYQNKVQLFPSLPPSPVIGVDSSVVDFGCVVNEHQITSRRFTVCNTGTKEGSFIVHTSSLPPAFTVATTEGRLNPGQALDIVVSLLLRKHYLARKF